MSANREKLLEIGTTAYPQIEKIGLTASLTPAGFTPERIAQGQKDIETFREALIAKQQAETQQEQLTTTLNSTLKEQISEVRNWRKAVKTADTTHNTHYYTQLQLAGEIPRGYTAFIPYAHNFYQTIQAETQLVSTLIPLGYTSERLQQALSNLDTLEDLNTQQEQAKGAVRQASQTLKELTQKIRTELRALKQIIQTIQPPTEAPATLTALNLNDL